VYLQYLDPGSGRLRSPHGARIAARDGGAERVNRRSEILIAHAMTAALCVSAAACQHSRQELAPATAPTTQAAAAITPDGSAAATPRLPDEKLHSAKHWVALGNHYFDAGSREKAIEAYGKALQLDPDNPDVLTDQGVLFRELGAFDKALVNFEKAGAIDPKHLPSILDLGVLYAQDLKDPEHAIRSWNRVIEIAPASPEAVKAKDYIGQVKQLPKPH
jgi:tetratricopeptide (TPR) repeat protein